jgi:hypothetical protein
LVEGVSEVVGERREDESKLMAVIECSEGSQSRLRSGRQPQGKKKMVVHRGTPRCGFTRRCEEARW